MKFSKKDINTLRSCANKIEEASKKASEVTNKLNPFNFMVTPNPENLRKIADNMEKELNAWKKFK